MASEWYTFWYWSEGPGKGQGPTGTPGASTLLPDPPPLVQPSTPTAIEPAAPPPVEQTFTNWGKVIPISMGNRRMSPMIIWLKAPVFIGVTIDADFCVSWGYNADDNPADTYCTALYANGTKIWSIEDGKLLPGSWDWTWYPGTESQGQDPTMVADKGAANTPAYRNQMLGVFTDFPLEKFGFKLPGISAEIVGSGSEAPRNDTWNPADKHQLAVLDTPYTLSKYVPPGWDGDDINDPDKGNYFSASGVRSKTFHKRGRYYIELTFDYLWTGAWYSFAGWMGVGLGVCLKTAPLAAPAGWQDKGVGVGTPVPYTALVQAPFDPAGPQAHRIGAEALGGPSAQGPPYIGQTETVALHIDMTQGYARARNVSQNSDWTAWVPYAKESMAANGLATVFSDIELGDPLYAYANVVYAPTIFLISASDRTTVNFGQKPFKGPIPSGATAWNGTGGTETFLGTLPLKDFISKIAIYCGIDPALELDFVGIDDVIHGGIITRDTVFRDFLRVLGRAYGFDFYEGDVIRLVRRVVQASYTVDKDIPPDDLLTDTDRAITTTRRKDDSPNEIELSYIDVTQQFRWNLQKARRILFPVKTTESKRKDAFSIPIVTTAKDALTMAGKAMYREAWQNVDHETKLTSKHFDLEPSDIVTLTTNDTEYTVKIAQISIEENMGITLRAVNLLTDEDMEWEAEAGEPALPYAGNRYFMSASEGADHASFSQIVAVMLALEGNDRFAGLSNTLVMAATDGADRFVGGQMFVDLAATDRPDTFTGTSAGGATMAVTDRPDSLAGFIDLNLTLDLDFTAM